MSCPLLAHADATVDEGEMPFELTQVAATDPPTVGIEALVKSADTPGGQAAGADLL